jgi:hypothetical protein
MNETQKSKSGWRIVRWILLGMAVLVTLIAIFYTEEDWRGKRAWENCRHELEAKGMVLDWDKFIPPPVPDDQNFFEAPKMAEWFVGRNLTNDLYLRITDNRFREISGSVGSANNLVTNIVEAKEYLAWSDQFEPDFALIRGALKRPFARMDGDYSHPFENPIPNFITMRVVAQVLAQRSHCFLMLGQPAKALHELALLNGYRRLLENRPTGRSMTLVAAMINVAVTGLYVQALTEGLQRQAWDDAELATIQEQLAEINLVPCMTKAFAWEAAATCHAAETMKPGKILDLVRGTTFRARLDSQVPHGWIYQNMATHVRLSWSIYDSLFDTNQLVTPKRLDEAWNRVQIELQRTSFFNLLSKIALPNYPRAFQTFAEIQTKVNEAQIGCALERFRLVHGEYPATLDALMPQFIEKLPHDLIGGETLKYRRTEGGKFLLYSVGWNETDDGGQVVVAKDGSVDREKGDWVWQYPVK